MEKSQSEERVLDLRGLRCPLPALRTEKALAAMTPGTVLLVLADDPLAGLDIPHLCSKRGDELLATETLSDHRRFKIRKGASVSSP